MQVSIEQGLKILSWFENHPSNEVPPEYMWDDDEAVEKWFNVIQNNKDNGYPTGEDEDGNPMMLSNDLADTFRNL